MNQVMFDKLRNEKPNERYKYFIKKIVDSEKIYSLYNKGWALYSNGEQNLLPLWSDKEFAKDCINDEFSEFEIEEIDLYDFLDEFSFNLEKDKVGITIFPTYCDNGIVISIKYLVEEITSELKKYL